MFSYTSKLGVVQPPTAGAATTVLLDGSVYLWRTKVCLDVMIIQHKSFGVVELVTYEPIVDQEAPRLYICDEILVSKLSNKKIGEAMKDCKMQRKLSNKKIDDTTMKEEAVQKIKLEFIMSHLRVLERSLDPRTLIVGLVFTSADQLADKEGGKNWSELVATKPVGLKRFISPHYMSLM
jgi:hypothetical protein